MDAVSVTDNVPWYAGIASDLASVYQQKQLMDVNAQRIANGLPPVDVSALAPTVNVGLPADQVQLVTIIGVGIIAALFLMGRNK